MHCPGIHFKDYVSQTALATKASFDEKAAFLPSLAASCYKYFACNQYLYDTYQHIGISAHTAPVKYFLGEDS